MASTVPAHSSPKEACCIWVAYLTCYYALFELAKIKADDYVLITAGSSSAGMAAMEMCKMVGAKTIATSRTNKNRDYLLKIGYDHVIAQSDNNMSESIMEFTEEQGVRIIYDPIGGRMMQEYANAFAQNAIVFLYGSMDHHSTILPEIVMTQKAVCVRPFTVYNHIYEEASRERGVKFVYNALKRGYIKAYVEKVYPLEKYHEAFTEQLKSTTRRGKMVVSIR